LTIASHEDLDGIATHMPICEVDPWRIQYFASARCPPDVRIPMEDSDAWMWNSRHRWVYDRIAIAHTQGLVAGPHGTVPPSFPVFSKPIVNLKGMGLGTRILRTPEEYDRHCTAGHMWMQLLTGLHVSSDVAVVRGEARWWRHVTGVPAGGGTFDYWTVHADSKPALEASLGRWIAAHLGDYTGLVNLETVGGSIIEAHLRPSDQWPDLYGRGWVDALIHLYSRGEWIFADRDRRVGYSVVLFDRHDVRWRHPSRRQLADIRALPTVSSVQITFHEDRDPLLHAMPPGGFRLAIVNCWNFDVGLAARNRLRTYFRRALKAESADAEGADRDAGMISSGAPHWRGSRSEAAAGRAASIPSASPGSLSDTAILP